MQDCTWLVLCVLNLWEEPPLNFQMTNITFLFYSEFICAFFHLQPVRKDLCMSRFKPQAWESLFVHGTRDRLLTLCTPNSSPLQARKILGTRSWGSLWMMQPVNTKGSSVRNTWGVAQVPQCSCLVPSYPTQLLETFNWGRQVLTWELQMTPSLAEWHYKLTCKFQSNSHCTRNLHLDKWIAFTEVWRCY